MLLMVKELIFGKQERVIKVNGSIANEKDMESGLESTRSNIEGSGKTAKQVDKGRFSGQMAQSMLDRGRTI